MGDGAGKSGKLRAIHAGAPLLHGGKPGSAILVTILTLYLVATGVWPLIRLTAELFRGNEPPWSLVFSNLSSGNTFVALLNTLDSAAWSSILATLIGTVAAIVVAVTDIRFKHAATFLFLLPLLIPSQITAIAWKELLSLIVGKGIKNPLYSREGVILLLGIENSAAVFLSVRASLRGISRDLIEAARVNGARPKRIVALILLPLIVPGILAGLSISFVGAIGNFGIPAMLGIPGRYTVLSTLIYRKLNGFGPSVLGETAILSLVLISIAGIGLGIRTIASRKIHVAHPGESGKAPPFTLNHWRLPVETILFALVAAISLLPLGALTYASLVPAVGVNLSRATVTLSNYHFIFFEQATILRAFRNSLLLSSGTALLSAMVAIPLAYMSIIRKNKFARFLDSASEMPYAIPGIVLSIAMILSYIKPLPLIGSLYGSFWILLIAYLARFLAPVSRTVASSLEGFDVRLEEAAQSAGAGMFKRLVSIILPFAAPAAGTGVLLVFMQALNELTVSSLLWSTGNETVGTVIFSLQYEGNSPAAAAISVTSIFLTLVLAFAVGIAGRKLPDGVIPWRS